MATPRRMGTETSETRMRLLDVTERIMIDDGYGAVSSRRIANDAGVTPALVHYYFGTLDDLFLALLRRRGEQQLARQERKLSAAQPLRSLWEASKDPDGAGLLTELMALANHRKVIKAELAVAKSRRLLTNASMTGENAPCPNHAGAGARRRRRGRACST